MLSDRFAVAATPAHHAKADPHEIITIPFEGASSDVDKQEEYLWITKWDCARLCQELDDAQDFLSALRMQIGSTEVVVDHLRRDLRAQQGTADLFDDHGAPDHGSVPAELLDSERDSNRLRDSIAQLIGRQEALELTRVAVVAQVTQARRERQAASARYRWRLSEVIGEEHSASHRLSRVAFLLDHLVADVHRQQSLATQNLKSLEDRLIGERRSVYKHHQSDPLAPQQPASSPPEEEVDNVWTSPIGILQRAVDNAKETLRTLTDECDELEREGRSLEATSQLSVAVVLSHEREEERSRLIMTKDALTQALAAADGQHLKLSADLDVLEGQLMSGGSATATSSAPPATNEDEAHRLLVADSRRRRFLDQLTALRVRLKGVRDASRAARTQRQASVVRLQVKLPNALRLSSAAREDMNDEATSATAHSRDALEDWSAQLRTFEKQVDVERRTKDHLVSREAVLLEEIARGKQQLQTIDGLVAAYRAASFQLR